MDIEPFRNWLIKNGTNKKVAKDTISRLRRLERELSCDIDDEYFADGCQRILGALENNGNNDILAQYDNINLPVGKYSMSTFRYSLNKYINYRSSLT